MSAQVTNNSPFDDIEEKAAREAWDEYVASMGEILSYLYNALPEKDMRTLAAKASSAGFVLASRMYQAGSRHPNVVRCV